MGDVVKTCLVCGTDVQESEYFVAFQNDLRTMSSKVPVMQKLTAIIGISKIPTELPSSLICRVCVHLVNEFDCIESKLLRLQKDISGFFFKTNPPELSAEVCDDADTVVAILNNVTPDVTVTEGKEIDHMKEDCDLQASKWTSPQGSHTPKPDGRISEQSLSVEEMDNSEEALINNVTPIVAVTEGEEVTEMKVEPDIKPCLYGDHDSSSSPPDKRHAYKFNCRFCYRSFSAEEMRDHEELHLKESHVVCMVCGETFSSPGDLVHHLNSAHGDVQCAIKSVFPNPDIICPDPDISFSRAESSCAESPGEKRTPVSQCSVCGKSLSKLSIGRHMMTIHGIKPFGCQVCGEQFEGKQRLRDHMLSHYSQEGSQSSVPENKEKLDPEVSDHSDKPNSGVSRKLPVSQCKLCGKYMSSMSINRHWMLVHNTKPFSCGFCGVAFSGKQELRKHALAHHQDIGPFEAYTDAVGASVKKRKLPVQKCDLCDVYVSLPSIKRHMKTIHDVIL